MFNLKSQKDINDLLIYELSSFNINQEDNSYSIKIGDDIKKYSSAQRCINAINESIEELKDNIFEEWNELKHCCELIQKNKSKNIYSIQNNIFLHYLQYAYNLSSQFIHLKSVTETLKLVFDIDIAFVNNEIIKKFNETFLKVYSIHALIMKELYRIKLLKEYQIIKKESQISGPWVNLDLPMSERVWSYGEDEEYFELRTKARKNQTRYNPEYSPQGFYYVDIDFNREPYDFNDRLSNSPYKGSTYFSTP
jgi:hypothetical protein